MDKIKLAMCDDVESLCKYFMIAVEPEADIEFVGMAFDSISCVEMVKEKKPDVLLLDIQMETNEAGVNAIPKIKDVSPDTKIIVLTIHQEDEYIFKAFTNGCIDYQIKTSPIEEILASIRAVHANKLTLRPAIAQKILTHCESMSNKHQSLMYMFNLMTSLSSAEFEVLRDLYDGYSYKEISQKRFVEDSTIRSQVTRILKKFETKDIKTLIKNLHAVSAFDIFKKK